MPPTKSPSAAAKSELLQGTLDMLLLNIVALEPMHGYAMTRRLQQISQDALQVPQGSLYPALHRLEYRKWLKSTWRETHTGRSAKFYSLTAAGRRQLDQQSTDWQRFTTAIELVMRAARQEPT